MLPNSRDEDSSECYVVLVRVQSHGSPDDDTPFHVDLPQRQRSTGRLRHCEFQTLFSFSPWGTDHLHCFQSHSDLSVHARHRVHFAPLLSRGQSLRAGSGRGGGGRSVQNGESAHPPSLSHRGHTQTLALSRLEATRIHRLLSAEYSPPSELSFVSFNHAWKTDSVREFPVCFYGLGAEPSCSCLAPENACLPLQAEACVSVISSRSYDYKSLCHTFKRLLGGGRGCSLHSALAYTRTTRQPGRAEPANQHVPASVEEVDDRCHACDVRPAALDVRHAD